MPKAAATNATTAAAKKGKSTTNKTKAKEAPPAKSIFPNLPGRASTTSPAGELSKKRKTTDAADKTATKAPPAKRSKTDGDGDKKQPSKPGKTAVSPKAAAKAAPKARSKTIINEAPNSPLHVYVFGEGSSGELGLGDAKNAIDVKRPRLNAHLPADKVGVVHVACGGMHVAALTRDGKVLTWGVNDQGALGRDTQWEGGLRDMDADSDDEDNIGLNPRESTPGAITTFPEGTVIVKLSAGDSHTLALTDDGNVFGWGTFRVCHSQVWIRLAVWCSNSAFRVMRASWALAKTPLCSQHLFFSQSLARSSTSHLGTTMHWLSTAKASSTLGARVSRCSLVTG